MTETEYEIFTTLKEAEETTERIDTLLGYPSGNTLTYRRIRKHPTQDKWACGVNDELKNQCINMSQEERDSYYKNLVTEQELIDEGFSTINIGV